MEPADGIPVAAGAGDRPIGPGTPVAERVRIKAARVAAHRKSKIEAARARSKAARGRKPATDTRTPEEIAVQHASMQHAAAINAQRRRKGREISAVAAAKRQVKKVARAVALGALLPDAPQILPDATEPLSMDPGPMIAAKLKTIGARLRDGSLRGDKDPVTGRSLIPPATLMSLPGVQAIALAVRFLPGGRDRFIEFIQLGALNADATCLAFWQIWAELTPAERQVASFDDVAAAGQIRPADLLSAIVKHAVNMGLDAGRLIMAATHPQVLEASIRTALREDPLGQTERFRLLEAQGVLPIPQKGPMVSIWANANALAGSASQSNGGDAAMLSPFAAALQAASRAHDDVIEGVIVEHDRKAERALLAPSCAEMFKTAIAAGNEAREPEAITISSAILGQKAG